MAAKKKRKGPKTIPAAQRQTNRGDGLTDLQRAVLDRWLLDQTQSHAACYRHVRPNVSANTAKARAHELWGLPKAQAYIAARREAMAKNLNVTPEKVIAGLAAIAFVPTRRFTEWGADGVVIHSSDDIPGEFMNAVAEVAEVPGKDGKTRVKVKFHDRRAALVDLAKYLDLFGEELPKEPAAADQPPEGKVRITADMDPEEATRIYLEMIRPGTGG